MKNCFISKLIVSVFLVILANSAYAWDLTRDFNSGALGMKAEASDAFSEAAGGAEYSNERSVEGGKSAKLKVVGGTEGFGYWGGIIGFPQKVFRGETIWLEMYIYMPDTFVIKTPGNGSLKFLRFRSRKADGAHSGYVDMQIIDDGSSDPEEFRMLREIQDEWFYYGQNGMLTRDKWHRVNVELTVDNIAVNQGGTAQAKFWLDGNLITIEKNIKAIISATDYIESFFLFTYWNGMAPKDQHLWVDNIQISNERPVWVDVLGGSKVLAPPATPTDVIVH
ncbi:MAG: hypothetical protein RQ936_05030 [Gammaproteobacteria bacterium]|nr:hypothetical protein [Gammaproteobacteria bacterium]